VTATAQADADEAPEQVVERPGRPDLRVTAVVLIVVGVTAGTVVGLGAGLLEQGRLLTWVTAGALVVPCVVAAVRGRRWPSPWMPILVGFTVVYILLPGLLKATAASGPVSEASLTVAEFRQGDRLALLLVLAFLLPLTVIFGSRAPYGRHARSLTGALRPAARTVVRVRPALLLGIVASVIGLVGGIRYGVHARDIPGGGGGVLGLFVHAAIFIPAALWLANQRLVSLLLLPLSLAGPYLQGGRQDVLTPLTFLLLAMLAQGSGSSPASRRGRATKLIGVGVLALFTVTALVTVTATKRTAAGDPNASSAVDTLVGDQSQFAPLIVAVVREPHPQWFALYERGLAAPVPRALWPDKPLSYDYAFRARHFPQYDGGIPITIIGTAYLSFGVPGVLAAGFLMGALAMLAVRLFQRRDPRSVLLSAAVVLLAGDIMRVGGLYREFITFALPAGLILLLTRRVLPEGLRSRGERFTRGAGSRISGSRAPSLTRAGAAGAPPLDGV
jgi:hypothetical protein